MSRTKMICAWVLLISLNKIEVQTSPVQHLDPVPIVEAGKVLPTEVRSGVSDPKDFSGEPMRFVNDTKASDRVVFNFYTNPGLKWTNGIVPYEISNKYAPELKKAIRKACMDHIEKKTCIRFIPRTTEKDYIVIQGEPGSGCWAETGRKGGKQIANLDPKSCIVADYPGPMIHELMHVLGFQHEHQRPDRDKYIKINWANIAPRDRFNFDVLTEPKFTTYTDFPYEYDSVMHYIKSFMAINPSIPTMIPLNKPDQILGENWIGLTLLDIARVNRAYQCLPSQIG